jgi:vancomycin resistance protein YoaR
MKLCIRQRRFAAFSILCILSLLSLPNRGAAQEEVEKPESKLGNVRIAGISVRGLTPKQARQLLMQKLEPRRKARLTLTDGKKTLTRRRLDLGIRPDVEGMVARAKAARNTGTTVAIPLRWKADRPVFQRALRKLAPAFQYPGKNARIVERRGSVRVVPAVSQRVVDVGASTQRLANLIENKASARMLRLVVRKKPPQVTAEKLKGITGQLSRFTTYFNPTKTKRVHNIRLAVRSIHGRILPPGHVFSLNDTVGERTQQRGYRTAPVIERGKVVPGIGGGVSQVTATLFNAALLAGLPIEEYHAHSKPVLYLPPGRDATVAWNARDLKFKNTTHGPLYLDYRVSGNRLTATLYGKRPPSGRRIVLKVNAKRLAPEHIKTELYRIVKQSGKIVRKERIGASDYNWKPDASD